MRGLNIGATPNEYVDHATIAAAGDLLRAQRTSEAGEQHDAAGISFDWDLATDEIRWSPGFSDLTVPTEAAGGACLSLSVLPKCTAATFQRRVKASTKEARL